MNTIEKSVKVKL